MPAKAAYDDVNCDKDGVDSFRLHNIEEYLIALVTPESLVLFYQSTYYDIVKDKKPPEEVPYIHTYILITSFHLSIKSVNNGKMIRAGEES